VNKIKDINFSLKKVNLKNKNEINSIIDNFYPEKLEEITEILIEELFVKYGMPKADLRVMKNMGLRYCREKNSFLSKIFVNC